MRRFLLAVLMLLPLTARAQDLTVFAAASLTDAMQDIGTLWQQDGHPALRQSFGASSTLARQIEQGAPANLFASADEKWMDYLVERNLIAPGTRRQLLGNDLVLIVPADHATKVQIGPGFDLLSLLGPSGRIATASMPGRPCASSACGTRWRHGWRAPRTCVARCCWSSAARRRRASSTAPTQR
jgi:molybdate transport system substrate-binding protein